MKAVLQKATLALVYLLAVAFSLKNLLEPDLWWQLRTGEWMLENGSFPHADPFSYTYAGTPWQNIKWGFEVIIALFTRSMGTEMLMLVQVLCSIGIVYFLLRLAKSLAPEAPSQLAYLITGLSFIVLEYRITGRPETITHLFFLMLLTILLEFRKTPSKTIWWIPLMMMAWANLHEAFGIGLVLLGVFMVSAWVEALKMHTQTRQQAQQLSIMFGLSLVTICLNPNFFQILLKPFEIAGQVYENKYTSEFTTYNQPMFWTKEAWITLGMLVFIVLATGIRFFKGKQTNQWERLNVLIPLPLVVLTLMLVYLACNGHRNIIFTTLVLVPLLIAGLQWLFQKINLRNIVVSGITIVLFVLLYAGIVSNRYYSLIESKYRYGLEVPAYATPVGAANYLEQHQLIRQAVFSDYLTSSYLLWRLQPTFKTFIDLRDLDVFPAAHFDRFMKILSDPSMFEQADSQYHFGSVVLLRAPQMQTLHQYLYNHPTYRLSYLDGVCCVYVKDSSLSKTESFDPLQFSPASGTALTISKIFNPLYKPNDLSDMDEVLSAGEYYFEMGNMPLAANYAHRSVDSGKDAYRGLELLGQIAYQNVLTDTSSTRQQWADSATTFFNKAHKLNPEYVPLLIDLGVKAFNEQQLKSAVNYLKKACELAPDNLKAQRNLAEVYKTMALSKNDQKTLELAIEHYNKADHINPYNPDIMMNLGFLYFRLGDCEHAVEFLEQIVDYPNITELQRSRARECIQKCR
jgi:hypothetical protein